MPIVTDIKSLEELIRELSFQSSTLLKKLNDTEFENFYEVLKDIESLMSQYKKFTKDDYLLLLKSMIEFKDVLKITNTNLKLDTFRSFDSSVSRLSQVQFYTESIFDKSRQIYLDVKHVNEDNNMYYKNQKKEFNAFQNTVKSTLINNMKIIQNSQNQLKKMDFTEVENHIKKELKNIFTESIQKIARNNELAQKLSEKNILSIKKHNQSIRTINLKAIIAAFIIAFFIGVLSITTFQVDILKQLILAKQLKKLEKIELLKNELLENNVEVFIEDDKKYIVINKKYIKKAYISDGEHVIVSLK